MGELMGNCVYNDKTKHKEKNTKMTHFTLQRSIIKGIYDKMSWRHILYVTDKVHAFLVKYPEIIHRIKPYLVASFYSHLNRSNGAEH